jgi:hypothetical protein
MNFATIDFKPDRAFYSEALAVFYSSFEPARRPKIAEINVHISALQAETVKLDNKRRNISAGWTEHDHLNKLAISQCADADALKTGRS